MADKKFTDFAIKTTPVNADSIPIVDSEEATPADQNKRVLLSELRPLKRKVVDIGDWNMDSTISVGVNHLISSGSDKIKGIQVVIRRDSDATDPNDRHFLNECSTSGVQQGCVSAFTDGTVSLIRITGGQFDNADYDFKTAKAMLDAKRYVYTVFMCQQSIEKIIKALHLQYFSKEAPRSHNLSFLIGLLDNIRLKDKKLELLAELTAFYIDGRYPTYKERISKLISKAKAEKLYSEAKKVYQCLKKLIK